MYEGPLPKCPHFQNLAPLALPYFVVGDDPERDGGDVERVSDKVDDVPHVVDVLTEANVPKLLDLAPDQT